MDLCDLVALFVPCRFVVRDFVYNEEELAAGKSEITKLEHDKKKQYVSLVQNVEANLFANFRVKKTHASIRQATKRNPSWLLVKKFSFVAKINAQKFSFTAQLTPFSLLRHPTATASPSWWHLQILLSHNSAFVNCNTFGNSLSKRKSLSGTLPSRTVEPWEKLHLGSTFL